MARGHSADSLLYGDAGRINAVEASFDSLAVRVWSAHGRNPEVNLLLAKRLIERASEAEERFAHEGEALGLWNDLVAEQIGSVVKGFSGPVGELTALIGELDPIEVGWVKGDERIWSGWVELQRGESEIVFGPRELSIASKARLLKLESVTALAEVIEDSVVAEAKRRLRSIWTQLSLVPERLEVVSSAAVMGPRALHLRQSGEQTSLCGFVPAAGSSLPNLDWVTSKSRCSVCERKAAGGNDFMSAISENYLLTEAARVLKYPKDSEAYLVNKPGDWFSHAVTSAGLGVLIEHFSTDRGMPAVRRHSLLEKVINLDQASIDDLSKIFATAAERKRTLSP